MATEKVWNVHYVVGNPSMFSKVTTAAGGPFRRAEALRYAEVVGPPGAIITRPANVYGNVNLRASSSEPRTRVASSSLQNAIWGLPVEQQQTRRKPPFGSSMAPGSFGALAMAIASCINDCPG